MGLMSDEILGESEEGTMPLHDNGKRVGTLLRGSSSHSRSHQYLRRAGVEKKSASEHRRTCVKSALFSALDIDDSSSIDSLSTALASPQVSAHSRSAHSRSTFSIDYNPNSKGSRKEASKRLKKRLPSRSPQLTRKLTNAVPPPPPRTAPQTSRKSLSHSGNDSEHSASGRRRSAFLFGSSSGKDTDSSSRGSKRGVRRSVSLSGGKKNALKSLESGHAPCAPSLDNLEPRRKAPGRSVSLSGMKKHSATLTLKKPKEHVRRHSPKKSAARELSLSAFLSMNSQRDDLSEAEDDDLDSVVSEQSWISWAANSALKPLEKLYDDVNGVDRKRTTEKQNEDDDAGDKGDFPAEEAETYKLSTTDKIKGLRFVASKQKRRSLYV